MAGKSKRTHKKTPLGKYAQIEKRKKMMTNEIKKVVGGDPPIATEKDR